MRKKSPVSEYDVVPFTDLDEFREFMGPLAEGYADGELRQLRDEMRLMAELLLDYWLWKRKNGL
jgi:hypothetical protein